MLDSGASGPGAKQHWTMTPSTAVVETGLPSAWLIIPASAGTASTMATAAPPRYSYESLHPSSNVIRRCATKSRAVEQERCPRSLLNLPVFPHSAQQKNPVAPTLGGVLKNRARLHEERIRTKREGHKR